MRTCDTENKAADALHTFRTKRKTLVEE